MRRLVSLLWWASIATLFFIAAWPTKAKGGSVDFTPPTKGMLRADCCLVDTAAALHDCYIVDLYVFGQQSPTWVAKRDSMLASKTIFAKYWPKVRLEAEPRKTASVSVCPPFVGKRTISYPDSLRNRAAYVVARNSVGGFCWSNVVGPLP